MISVSHLSSEAKIALLVLFPTVKRKPRTKLRFRTRDSGKDLCCSTVYFLASQHTEHWRALCKNLISGDFRNRHWDIKSDSFFLTMVNFCIILLILSYCCERGNRNIFSCSWDGHYLNSFIQTHVLIVIWLWQIWCVF